MLFSIANFAFLANRLSATLFNSSTVIFLLSEISATISSQIDFKNAVICALLSSLILLYKNGSTALLYFPCLITSIFTPVLSSKSLKNNISEAKPLKSTNPTGFIKIESATELK